MKKELNIQIGARVRTAREAMGLSREELAELLDISTLFMSYIECGQKGMSLETLVSICRTLGVSADYILLGVQSSAAEDCDAQRILAGMLPQYLPLAADTLRNLQKTIAVVRAEPALPERPRQKAQNKKGALTNGKHTLAETAERREQAPAQN